MSTKRGKKSDLSSEEVRASILAVAARHFATNGMAGASLKDIAAEAGVAGSLINYHFEDKVGLFTTLIANFTRSRNEVIARILGEPHNRDEFKVRLELFIEELQSSIIGEPHGYAIIDREMRSHNPIVFDIFENTLLLSFRSLVQFFEQARANDLLCADCDPQTLAIIMFTTCCDSVRKDELGKRFLKVSFEDPAYRRKFAQQVSALFLRGVMK